MRHLRRMRYEWRMASAPSADDLLTTREVADLCRVSTATVARWSREGHLDGTKVGPRTLRFRRADVEALIAPPEPVGEAS